MEALEVNLDGRLTAVKEACGQCRFLSKEPDEPNDWCIALEVAIRRKTVASGGLRRLRHKKCLKGN